MSEINYFKIFVLCKMMWTSCMWVWMTDFGKTKKPDYPI
jgi:hypothetical protein